MPYTTSYYKEDLHLQHSSSYVTVKENTYIPDSRNLYYIFVMFDGEAQVQNGDEVLTLTANQMTFVNANDLYAYNFHENQSVDWMEIIIHPTVFNDKSEDKEFLRSFHNMPRKKRVIDLMKKENIAIRHSINGIAKCLDKHLGRDHILPRINTIVSELDMKYDEISDTITISSDSVVVQVMDYISTHYLENITYATLTEKFFVSKPTLIKMVKLNTHLTLHRFIEKLRMKDAIKLMSKGVALNKISKMCGYDQYSTFLRAYKRTYGVLPTENNRYKKKKKWPLT